MPVWRVVSGYRAEELASQTLAGLNIFPQESIESDPIGPGASRWVAALKDAYHLVTETTIRAFWGEYRELMGY